MSSGISSMKMQWTIPQTKKYGVIKVLPSFNYSICFLSSLLSLLFTSNGICSCSSKLPSSLLFIQTSSDSFSSSLWHFPYPISSNACNFCPLSESWRRLFLQCFSALCLPFKLQTYLSSSFSHRFSYPDLIKSQSCSFLKRIRVLVHRERIW